jgi:hypothetical protein
MFESPLAFRLVFVSGENNAWIDYIQFSSVAAVEPETWGSIKNLFRSTSGPRASHQNSIEE